MIEYNPKNWFTLIFQPHRSDQMRYLVPNVIMMGAYSAVVTYIFLHHWDDVLPATAQYHSLLGIVLGLVLVFRTNTAYDRWWEGRKLWGAMVNNSRSFSLKLSAMLAANDVATRQYFAATIGNFSFALKEHLRSGVKAEELQLNGMDYRDELGKVKHKPNLILKSLQAKVMWLLTSGKIDGDQYRVLQRELEAFADNMGACERIRKTPIPYTYSMYVKKVIFAYLVSLPVSFIESFQWWTIPAVMLTTYVLAGIEMIAEEIEDPFGTDANDLDTDGISVTIRRDVHEILELELDAR